MVGIKIGSGLKYILLRSDSPLWMEIFLVRRAANSI
jgi:hypothetical protein